MTGVVHLRVESRVVVSRMTMRIAHDKQGWNQARDDAGHGKKGKDGSDKHTAREI